MSLVEADPFDVRRVRVADGLLRAFNDAGVLGAAEVHVASRLAGLAGESDEAVVLAVALAVRGPRLGHVCVDLETIRETATVDAEEPVDVSALPWPEPASWLAAVRGSALVGDGRPLQLEGTLLYLDRYWREERAVAADLVALAGTAPADVDEDTLHAGLTRLFPDDPEGRQARAAATAVRRRFTVVAGGPGTGKTTTVAKIVELLREQATAAGRPEPLVALAAPTGKAAARLGEASGMPASTLHRLLGRRPGSHSRFKHDRHNRLPHDVVIVDETSMVSLSLMARLLEAVRPEARVVLVGDPGQLTSIEAGAVLADIVGAEGEGIVVLERVHRYGGGIGDVAEAIRRGDADAALHALAASPDDVTWIAADVATPEGLTAATLVRTAAVESGTAVVTAARAGDTTTALHELAGFRLLCAHRRGPHGVAAWTARVEGWLAEEIDGFAGEGRWYPGRPLMVTENDYVLRLFNGDTGVVVSTENDAPTAAFERQDGLATIRPGRLSAVETVYAMTVHKSQGSQFRTAAVVLPDESSHLLTRELLYTAVTRAQDRLILVATEEALRAAIARPVARASGLGSRLVSAR